MMMVMKMAVVSIGLLLLLLGSTSEGCDFYVATKQDFAVPLNYIGLKDSDQLEWQHNNTIIFRRKGSDALKENVYPNGSLKLRNVDLSKSGKYTPFVYVNGRSKGDLKTTELCVMEPVLQPRVTSECRGTDVILTCNPKQSSPGVSYEWLQNNKKMSENVESFKKPLKSTEKSQFKCHVSNRVSSLTSAPLQPSCQKEIPPVEETDSSSFFELISANMWIIVGSGGGLVLLLIIIVIIFCIRNRRRKRRQLKEEEELRLDWSNSNPQHPHQSKHQPPDHQDSHHHHHHHHHQRQQQQPAGHTGPRQHRSKQPCAHKQNQGPQGPQGPQVPSHHSQPGGRRATPAPKPPVEDDAEEHPPLPQPRRKVQKTAPKAPQD